MMPPGAELDDARAIIEASAREAGRDPADLGMQGRANYTGDLDALIDDVQTWRAVGAAHVLVSTVRAGVDEHVAVLTEAALALNLACDGL